VARKPHVDQEALGRLSGFNLEGVKEGTGGGGFVRHGVPVGCWVAVEEVRHHDDVALGGEAVGLDLVVYAVEACPACQEKEELRGGMRVVGGFGDVDLCVVLVLAGVGGSGVG